MRHAPLLALFAVLAAAAPAAAATHGDVVSVKKTKPVATLKGAAKDLTVTYLTKGVGGKLVPVTGTVAFPKGAAPKGGWPVLNWAHGSTGIADKCAPSIRGKRELVHPMLLQLLKAGFVVVRTDYEGLGTPGVHPFFIGTSEGRSVLDIARAARKLDANVGRRVIIAGHSQGGHAALWAASLAPKWTPELKVGGTVAFAPASHTGEQAAVLRSLETTVYSGLASLIIRGADAADPSLGIESALTDKARALWPEIETKCFGELSAETSWGGLKASELFRPEPDAAPLLALLNANDPETLTIRGAVLVLQGGRDSSALPAFTDALVKDLLGRGTKLTYGAYPELDHGSITTDAKSVGEALAFIRKRR